MKALCVTIQRGSRFRAPTNQHVRVTPGEDELERAVCRLRSDLIPLGTRSGYLSDSAPIDVCMRAYACALRRGPAPGRAWQPFIDAAYALRRDFLRFGAPGDCRPLEILLAICREAAADGIHPDAQALTSDDRKHKSAFVRTSSVLRHSEGTPPNERGYAGRQVARR
jgi:hypothetical protein